MLLPEQIEMTEKERRMEFWENTYLPQTSLPLSFLSSCGVALRTGPI